MKTYMLIGLAVFPLLTGCEALRRITGIRGSATGNTAPMSVIVDGQSNGERLPTDDLLKSFAREGFSDVTITNISVGGTYLKEHTAGGRLYAHTIDTVTAIKPTIYIWWQGEAEAALGGPGKDTYGQDLTNFVGDLRSRGGDFRFIYIKVSKNMTVGISPDYPNGTPFWQTVRDAQNNLMIQNSAAISIDDLSGDGLHYYPPEYQTVADRIAANVVL